ncbi:MAG: FtsX-like permease family protein [Oscillospiraceae bacterium]|nr:FtsX-like permease family protein [Oscillospiraceae bacterium]
MNILNKVTLKTLLKNRTRTIVTVIGIMLASALICAVTTFVSSFYDTLIGNEIYRRGDYHRFFYDQDKDFYEQMVKDERVGSATFVQELGYFPVDEESTFYLYVIGTDGNFEEKNMGVHVVQGKYPSSPSEIMFSNLFLGEYNIGDTITIDIGQRWYNGMPIEELDGDEFEDADNYVIGGEELRTTETRTYTVSGFYSYSLGTYSAALSQHIGLGWPVVTIADEGMPAGYTYNVFVKMKNPADALSFYIGEPYSGSNETLLAYMGVTPFDALNFTIWGLAALVIAIVMVGSVSLIYNAFAISVSERTKQFGLLSSIGATQKQLRRSVLFEALVVSMIGIPLGAVLGIGIVAVAIEFLGDLLDSLRLAVPVTVSANVLALAIGIGVSLLTVFISAWIPSKRATKITAIEAIRQNKDITAQPVKTSKLTAKLFGLPGVLAAKYYKRSKKRYKSTVISLVISIVLFISITAFFDYFVTAIFYHTDVYNYDLEVRVYDDESVEKINYDSLLEEYKNAYGVTAATYIAYGDPSEPANSGASAGILVGVDKSYINSVAFERGRVTDHFGGDKNPKSDNIMFTNATITFVGDEAFKELLAQYGLSEAEFMDPDKPLAVVLDGNRMYDMYTGKNLETHILSSDRAEIIMYAFDTPEGMVEYKRRNDKDGNMYVSFTDSDMYFYEDKISEDAYEIMTERMTMNVGKVIYELPYFINVRYNDLGIIYPISLIGKVCPKWEGTNPYYYLVCSDHHAASAQAIEEINNMHGFGGYMEDYAERAEHDRGLFTTIQTAVNVFVGIISLISVANVFNTISTNIGLRRREFAMLKSVGMTSGGFNRMMIYETILYGVKSLLYGLPAAMVITVVIHLIIAPEFEMSFRMPWGAIGIAMLSVFTAVILTMLYALSKVKRANPIDELKNENI